MSPLAPPDYTYDLAPLGNFLRTPLQVTLQKMAKLC